MTDYIPYGRQDVTDEDIAAVIRVLRSDFLTQGPTIEEFEDAVARYAGAQHAVAVNSATSALHIACMALELARGDWLWSAPITFVASTNCALYCGASVDFVDIDPGTSNISIAALEAKLDLAELNGTLPKILVAVHLTGLPCPMAEIARLSKRYGFRVIEDASHAIGGSYLGEPIGKCTYSDITVFSFHPVKIVTTAEGGMALTNDGRLAMRMQRLRSHGITRDPAEMNEAPHGPWYYQQIDLGYNYRLTDIQAALGLSQLSRLDAYVAKRHQIAHTYDDHLAELPLLLPHRPDYGHSAFHLYVIRMDPERTNRARNDVFEILRHRQIGVNVHYIPVHLQPFYKRLGFKEGDFPNAEEYYRRAISIPMYPGLTSGEQEFVIQSIREAMQG
jgi:UDP-4-amino-4,6-dideoxy-N-acetyl-beta-L-altrosamine transaminase